MTKILRRRAPRKPFSGPDKPIFTGLKVGAGDFAGTAKNFALFGGRIASGLFIDSLVRELMSHVEAAQFIVERLSAQAQEPCGARHITAVAC